MVSTMEGGVWGIVIIISAFMIQVLTFGTTASIGVYNIELLDYFPGSSVGVSLIGSINFGVYLGSGPIVSYLMTRFSYRKIALCGSALVAVGLIGLPFLPYIPTMCLFFGVLTGFGNCCAYIPSHVLSGLYYDKYRSIATGISTSGSGLGSAVVPVLVGFLIDVYSWKGSIIFVAGLNLHLFIFAALLRYPATPTVGAPPPKPPPHALQNVDLLVSDVQDETECLVTPKKHRRDEKIMETSKISDGMPTSYTSCAERPKSYTSCDSYQNDKNYDNFGVDMNDLEFIDRLSTRTNKSSVDNFSDRLLTSTTTVMFSEDCKKDISYNSLSNASQSIRKSTSVGFSDNTVDTSHVKLRNKRKVPQTKRKDECQSRGSGDKHRISFLDVFYPQSLSSHSLFALGSRGSSVIYIDTIQHISELRRASSTTEESIISKTPRSARHIYIFTNYGFNIYFLSNIMWNAGYAIIQSFAPEFLQQKGLTLMEAAWLSGSFGLSSFVGGVLGGVVGNIECTNRQALYMLACITMGVVTIIFPLYQHIVLYTATLITSGLAFGVILGLLIVVLTDLVGVESLGNGLGYLMLSNGLGSFIGPPIASLLKEATGGFEMGILLAGALCILGGLIMLLMPCRRCCLHVCSRRKKPKQRKRSRAVSL